MSWYVEEDRGFKYAVDTDIATNDQLFARQLSLELSLRDKSFCWQDASILGTIRELYELHIINSEILRRIYEKLP